MQRMIGDEFGTARGKFFRRKAITRLGDVIALVAKVGLELALVRNRLRPHRCRHR
jgi:hypothetical protein